MFHVLCSHLSLPAAATAILFVLPTLVAAADPPAESVVVPTEEQLARPDFWRRLDGKPVESTWEFADGEIRLIKPSGGSASLLSPPLPPDFELSWRYKIGPKTNSGIKYRVRQFGKRWLGIEYQIIDEPLTPQAAGRIGSTASIYALVAPDPDKPNKPPGEWNESRVVARGRHLEHYLNGRLVASAETGTPDWQERIEASKFAGLKGFGGPEGENRIMLTDHGGKIVYKDLRFVPLSADENAASPRVDGDRSNENAPQ